MVVLGPESDDEDNNMKISQNIIVDVVEAIIKLDGGQCLTVLYFISGAMHLEGFNGETHG